MRVKMSVFFFNDTATTDIYTYLHTLSLHDALPIYIRRADDTEFERNARFLRVTDRRGRSRIGHRDHQVGIDRIFAREFGADRLAYRIDRKSTRLNSSH